MYFLLFGPTLGSAYTEPFPMRPISASLSADEDHGRTSEEEEGGMDQGYDRQVRHEPANEIQGNKHLDFKSSPFL